MTYNEIRDAIWKGHLVRYCNNWQVFLSCESPSGCEAWHLRDYQKFIYLDIKDLKDCHMQS